MRKLITMIFLCCGLIQCFGQDVISRKQKETTTTQNGTNKKKTQGSKKNSGKNTNSNSHANSSSRTASILKVRGSSNPSSMTLKAGGETNVFVGVSGVNGTSDYTITVPYWITYYDKTTSGFKIRYNENTDADSRSGYITVDGLGQQVKFYVSQSSNYSPLKIEGKTDEYYNFRSGGEVKAFSVTNGLKNYKVSVPNWVYYQIIGKYLSIGCSENPSTTSRSGVVTISDGKSTATIYVAQNGSSAYKESNYKSSTSSSNQSQYSSKPSKSYKSQKYRFSTWTQHDNAFYIFAQGGVSLVDGEFAPAAGGGFGFNIGWYNMEWDYTGFFGKNGSGLSGGLSIGYNIFSERRFQLTPQAGLGVVVSSGDGYLGGLVALRWDIGVCHHLNFFLKPKVVIASTTVPSITGGLSVYF